MILEKNLCFFKRKTQIYLVKITIFWFGKTKFSLHLLNEL